jgi:MFS transporter, OFA family, oxalate/formate antiporter
MINQNLMVKRWFILAAGFVVNFMLGILLAWSVFVIPLMTDFGWSKSEVTLPFTIFILVFGLTMLPAGRVQDKIGPMKTSLIGSCLLGLGYMLSYFIKDIHSPILLYITIGLVTGLGQGFGYACISPVARKWFPDRPGTAVGITIMGIGASALFFAPLQKYFIERYGIPDTFLYVGIILIVLMAIASCFLRNPPEGWMPDKLKKMGITSSASNTISIEAEIKEVIKTRTIWILWVIFAFLTASGLLIFGHIAAYIEEIGIEPMYAAWVVGILSIFNAAGRPFSGFLCDKIGAFKTMLILFSMQTIILFLFPHITTNIWGLFLSVAVTGVNFGAIFTMFPVIVGDYWGLKNMGANYGIVYTAYGVGAILGPSMAAYIFDKTHQYNLALYFAGLLVFIAVMAIVYLMKQKIKQEQK